MDAAPDTAPDTNNRSYGTLPPNTPPLTPPQQQTRNITIDLSARPAYKHHRHTNKSTFATNYVSTAKYTAFSFLPMSLFEQFRRVANFYFLCISILMLIGTYTSYYDTPYAPWSTLAVLTLVVMISVVKGGLEDLKRHAADAQTNRRPVEKLLPAHNITSPGVLFKTLEWQDVRVGDIVRVANDGDIPADLVLLATSEDSGTAYIETSNINCEANLKVKTADRAGPWADPSDLT